MLLSVLVERLFTSVEVRGASLEDRILYSLMSSRGLMVMFERDVMASLISNS